MKEKLLGDVTNKLFAAYIVDLKNILEQLLVIKSRK